MPLVRFEDSGGARRRFRERSVPRAVSQRPGSAYDQHAIRAFESNALDYLLKPFSDERLEATMIRAKDRLGELKMREFGRSVMQMISARQASGRFLERLALKSGGVVQFVRAADAPVPL